METTDRTPEEAGARKRRLNSTIVAAGAAFGLTLAGLGVAAAQTDSGSDTTTTTTTAPIGAMEGRHARGPHQGETALTGEVAEKVNAAALEAVPGGTVMRVESDADGSPYEAHVRKADGTGVVVKIDESFEVTSTEEGHGPGMGGRHGGGAQAALTGEAAEKATAAAQAAVPDGTVLRVGEDRDGDGYHAHVRKADGTEVRVAMDDEFNVTGTEEFTPGPGGRHGHRHGPAEGEADADPGTETD